MSSESAETSDADFHPAQQQLTVPDAAQAPTALGASVAGPHPAASATRLLELDAIRGIAAFVVVLFHCWMAMDWPQYSLAEALAALTTDDTAKYVVLFKLTPLRIVTAGSAAVGVFFLLSGLVLTLPMLKARDSYRLFLFKRFLRLYPPFAASILLGACLWSMSGVGAKGLSDWFDSSWRDSLSAPLLGGHLLLLGTDSMQQINNVMWSLVHEMRISLIFPALAIVTIAYPRFALVGSFCMVSLVAYPPVFSWVRWQLLNMGTWWPLATALDTLHYLLYFVAGILIATKLNSLVALLKQLPSMVRAVLWIAAAGLLLARFGHVSHVIWAAGAALTVLLSLSSSRAHRFLNRVDLQWLGKISYSLYLVHLPILLFTMHMLADWKYRNLMLLMIPPLSLVTAQLFYMAIEAPSHKLGRRWLAAKRADSAERATARS
ncbi:MAG TPA: acyltransferase [Steroidobacteraceae bacterium]|nr:acyltransferase [Steroidobacteraceae bacterium]